MGALLLAFGLGMASCGGAANTGNENDSMGPDTSGPDSTPQVSCIYRAPNCDEPIVPGGLDSNCASDDDCDSGNCDFEYEVCGDEPYQTEPTADTVGGDTINYETEVTPEVDYEVNPGDSTGDDGISYETETANQPPVLYACNPDSMTDGKCPEMAVPSGKNAFVCLGDSCAYDVGGSSTVQEYPDLYPAGSFDVDGAITEYCFRKKGASGANCNSTGTTTLNLEGMAEVTYEIMARDNNDEVSMSEITFYRTE